MSKIIGIVKRSELVTKLKGKSYKNAATSRQYLVCLNDENKEIYIPFWNNISELYPNVYKSSDFLRRLVIYIKLYREFYLKDEDLPIKYLEDSKGYSIQKDFFTPTLICESKVSPCLIGLARIKNIYTTSHLNEMFKQYRLRKKSITKDSNIYIKLPLEKNGIYAEVCFDEMFEISIFVNITEDLMKYSKFNYNELIGQKYFMSFDEYEGGKILTNIV